MKIGDFDITRLAATTAALIAGAAAWQIVAWNTSPAFLSYLHGRRRTHLGIQPQWRACRCARKLAAAFRRSDLAAPSLSASCSGCCWRAFAWLRVALESYIMALYATPMVALIPFILSILGFGFAAEGACRFPVCGVSHPL